MADHTDAWDAAFDADPGDLLEAKTLGANQRQGRLATHERALVEHYWDEESDSDPSFGGLHKFPRDTRSNLDADVKSVGHLVVPTDERAIGVSDGSGYIYIHGHFVGQVVFAAFDVATPPGGFLECNGQEVSQTTYADLFSAIGSAFDNQDNAPNPTGGNFRVPRIQHHGVVGATSTKRGQAGYVRRVSGQNNLHVEGTYSGSARAYYIVEITASGTPDVFRWSDDGGATFTTGVSVGTTNVLSNGITIRWGATSGHSPGDIWIFVGDPALATVGAVIGADAWQLSGVEVGSHRHFEFNPDNSNSSLTSANHPAGANTSIGSNNYVIKGTATEPDRGLSGENVGDQAHENTPHVVALGPLIYTGV